MIETMLRFISRLSVREKTHPVKANELPGAFSSHFCQIECNLSVFSRGARGPSRTYERR